MNYSAINAKVKAMKQKLLTHEDYKALSMLGSVEEVSRKLREFPSYQRTIARLEGAEVHRNLLEHKIFFSIVDDFTRIFGFISDHRLRKYLNAFFLSFELQILNTLFCMVYDERDISYTMPELHELFGQKLHIDVSKLKNAKSISEIIDDLQGTELYSLLSNVRIDDEKSSLFQLEMQLDLYNYMHLWRTQKKYLDRNNLEVLEKIKGTEVDLRNIMWVYRLKKYYDLAPSLIYAYMIPINYKLKVAQLSKMVEASSEDALMNEIQASPYGKAFTGFTKIEQVFYREMYRVYHRAEVTQPDSLAVTVNYIHCKEVELKNITALLEGVRYRLEPEQIMGYLHDVRLSKHDIS